MTSNDKDYNSIPLTERSADKSDATHSTKPQHGLVSANILLLDGNTHIIEIEKKARGVDLLNVICEDLNLLEKDYFALSFQDKRDIKQWLSNDKKISKQLARTAKWKFTFEVKFYPTDPSSLVEDITRFQLGLQIRNDILSGKLPCSFITYALLGSFNVQSTYGDYDPDEHFNGYEYIKDMKFAPNQSDELLEKISELHRTHAGKAPNVAERQYLEEAKKLAMYGVDLHRARDSDNLEIMLGVCSQGLHVYRDRLRINRFAWPKILKFSYKRNNFYVKIRPGEFDNFESTIGFKLDNHQMAKRLWKTAVEHHTFFRLRESDDTCKNSFLPRFGSRFRYSGRTMFQARQASKGLGERNSPYVDRSATGTRYTGSRSMEGATSGFNTTERSELYRPEDNKCATLDLKGRRDRQGSVPFAATEDDAYLNNGNVDNERGYRLYISDSILQQQQHNPTAEDIAVVAGTGGDNGKICWVKTVKPGFEGEDAYPDERPRDDYGNVIEGTCSNEDGYWCLSDGSLLLDQFGNPMKVSDSMFMRDQHGNVIRPDHKDVLNATWNNSSSQEDHLQNHKGQSVYNHDGQYEYNTTTTTTTTTRTYKNEQDRNNKPNVYDEDEDDDEDVDHDLALADAINQVTNMNPDLSVRKIEIQTKPDDQ